MVDIGSQIKKYRQLAGLTQRQLAIKSNISRVSIGNYERGDRTPTINELQAISSSLGIEIGELLGVFDTTFPKTATERLNGIPKILLDAYVLEVIGEFLKERDNNEIHL